MGAAPQTPNAACGHNNEAGGGAQGSAGLSWGPDDQRGLNVGLYLHDSNPANGCVHMLPGRCAPQGRLSESRGPALFSPVFCTFDFSI